MPNVDNTQESRTVLSLCTGYGGIERGLELAGVRTRTLAHVEIEAFAAANLVAKMEEGKLVPAPVWTNLKTLNGRVFRNRVSILTGGYPCQPFSQAGKRLGSEDPRHLWPDIKRLIKSVRPVQCFFENVEGHITKGLREVIEDLEGLGYRTTWGIFSAREVGAPHLRKRVFILAHANRAGFGQSIEAYADGLPEQPHSFGVQFLPDSDSEGLEGRLHDGSTHPKGREEQSDGCTTERSDRGSWDRRYPWTFEPNVGRVVDGCADRVDRLRQLGNGVVPHTAAKAYRCLMAELEAQVMEFKEIQEKGECPHRFHYFGSQKTRRCVRCNKLESE